MHKIKVAIDKLRGYLGRDTEGLRLLDDISVIANTLRKEVAALTNDIEVSKDDALRARESLRLSEDNVRQLEESLQRESQMHAQETRRRVAADELVRKYENDTSQTEDDVRIQMVSTPPSLSPTDLSEYPLIADPDGFVDMMRLLRNRMKFAPGQALRQLEYNIHDITTDYSGTSMEKVGMFITSLSLLNLPTRIFAEPNFTTAKGGVKVPSDASKELFKRWFFRNNARRDEFCPTLMVDPRPLNPRTEKMVCPRV